jgi:opacity protein-like surface antigen
MLIRALALAGLAAAPASAGDLSPAIESRPPSPPAGSSPAPASAPVRDGRWSGGYVGVELSYGSGDANEAFGDDKSTGGFYGAISGYRYDVGRVVLGGEVSYDRTDITFPNGTDVDNLLRAGAMVGYDLGRFLPYVAGGYANVSLVNDLNDFDDTYHGGFYGVGLTYRVTDRILIGGEVAQHRFDADGTDADLTTFTGKIAYRF